MKIAVTSTGVDLDAQVDPRFGRCTYFLVVDTDTMEHEAFENEQADTRGGAGIQAGRFMAERDVKAVLTGNCGPNAYQTLSAAGIEIFTGVSGTVKEAVERYKNGEFTSTKSANVPSHFGMEQGKET